MSHKPIIVRYLLIIFIFLTPACANIPASSPYDSVIEQTTAEFDKEFQSFVVKLNRTAGSTEGKHSAHTEFYTKWRGQLAHLRNRAIASDPSDACPQADAIAGAYVDLAQSAGGMTGNILAETSRIIDIANQKLTQVSKEIESLESQLNQPEGTLTPEQLGDLRKQLKELTPKEERLSKLVLDIQDAKVDNSVKGCMTVVVASLESQFMKFEDFHKAQGNIGLRDQAKAPIIFMNVAIQNVLKVEAKKKQLQ